MSKSFIDTGDNYCLGQGCCYRCAKTYIDLAILVKTKSFKFDLHNSTSTSATSNCCLSAKD